MSPSTPASHPVDLHPDLLRDESQLAGTAEHLYLPRDSAAAAAVLRSLAQRGEAVTAQGARTGIAGGAVPRGGAILNLAGLDRLLGLRLDARGAPLLRVQPGLLLGALRRWLHSPTPPPDVADDTWRAFRRRRWRFTPDPTEPSASLGGMIACNASGACSFLHGATRRWVESLHILLPDGRSLRLSRSGGPFAAGRSFKLEPREETSGGGAPAPARPLVGTLPGLAMPPVKHAAGYWLADDMPLIDLFIGGEGTLGIVAEAEIRLLPAPAHRWGLLLMPPSEDAALELVVAVRAAAGPSRTGLGAALAAIEYFDAAALALLRRGASGETADLAYPIPPDDACCAVYFELEGDGADDLTAAASILAGHAAAGGIRDEWTWAASGASDLDRLKAFRHAVPESINQIIAARRRALPRLTKVGTDFAVPDARLHEVLRLYRDGLARSRLDGVIFGHVGDNHLHVNILPRDAAELSRAKEQVGAWAAQCVAWGGTVSAEHGVGKLKTHLLTTLYGTEGVREMRRLKGCFDPANRLNPGTLFAPEA
jgi:D-lactate dehydrogenase (cytochrome)